MVGLSSSGSRVLIFPASFPPCPPSILPRPPSSVGDVFDLSGEGRLTIKGGLFRPGTPYRESGAGGVGGREKGRGKGRV